MLFFLKISNQKLESSVKKNVKNILEKLFVLDTQYVCPWSKASYVIPKLSIQKTFLRRILRRILGDVSSNYYDTFGIFSQRWRVAHTGLLYRPVGHGPGMNRTGKVSEVTTFMSSFFRRILGEVTSSYYVFSTHLEFFLNGGGWHTQVFYTPV